MIRVIDQSNRDAFADTLEEQFRFRHAIFVKERGWTDFEQEGRYEVDQYDNEKTIYFVALDDDERVTGCFRLYPSTSPYMLSEHFAHLIDGDPPSQPDIFEMTRISVARDRRGSGTYQRLLAGLQEYCLEEGIIGAAALIRLHRLPAVQMTGFDVKPLGLPHMVDGEQLIAVMFEINQKSLERARAAGNLTGAVLERNLEKVTRRLA